MGKGEVEVGIKKILENWWAGFLCAIKNLKMQFTRRYYKQAKNFEKCHGAILSNVRFPHTSIDVICSKNFYGGHFITRSCYVWIGNYVKLLQF